MFSRDALPKKVKNKESSIVNLDSVYNKGTHWVCYKKVGNFVKYFDSFGNLQPPLELLKYFGDVIITYNRNRYQSFNNENCGQLCIQFLKSV